MTESPPQLPYTLTADDKAAGIMVYTASGLSWGIAVVKNQIRVSTWLRTNSAPEIICLYNARSLSISGGSQPKVLSFRELYIPITQIIAYHLRPPAADPLDFDPTEPNRKMEPVSVIVGHFKFDGSMRIASRISLATHLEISRENFLPLYDVEVSCPSMPALTPIKVAYVLIRNQFAAYGVASA
jgi:hypothetical protein